MHAMLAIFDNLKVVHHIPNRMPHNPRLPYVAVLQYGCASVCLCLRASVDHFPASAKKKTEAKRKQNGSKTEAFRKHFGSISEARNALFLEENSLSSFRSRKKIWR
jgi:hypothetical protein